MTDEARIEALKAEADKLGFRLVRKSALKLESCSCNSRKPFKVSKFYGGVEYMFYKCKDCRKASEEKTNEHDAIEAWNSVAND